MQAYVAHLMEQRVRLRVFAQPSETEPFRRLAEALSQHPEVERVRVTPRTGSVLVVHSTSLQDLVEHVQQQGLELSLVEAPPRTRDGFRTDAPAPRARGESPLVGIDRELRRLEARLRERSQGSWGLGEVAFYALLGATGVQLLRGEYFSAASALLEKAFGTLDSTLEEARARAAEG